MKTRNRILSAFKELVEEKGFYNATVDELAGRYGISKRTIYRHFSSKEEMIETVLQEFIRETERQVDLALASSEDPAEKITHFIKALSARLRMFNPRLFSDVQRYYPYLWEKVEQFRANKIQNIIKMIMDGSCQGYFKEINPVVATAALLAMVQAIVTPNFVLEHNLTAEEAFTTVIDTFLYGIVAKQP